ncbi:MAG: hypothetical protein ACI4L6_01145 [Candidatus Onthoplasma sp.]
MKMIKKWGSCVFSFIAGVLSLALSACSGMVAVTTIAGKSSTDTTKAFKVLTDNDLLTQAKEAGLQSEFITMKVFSIILTVVATLLIVYSIIMLLKNLNVIKSESKIFSIVGLCLIVLFLIATIGVLVSSNVYASAMAEHANTIMEAVKAQYAAMGQTIEASASVKIGAYQPIMLATGIVSALAIGFCEIKNIKEN